MQTRCKPKFMRVPVQIQDIVSEIPPSEAVTSLKTRGSLKTSRRWLLGAIFIGVAAMALLWLYNEVLLQKPLQRVLATDARNRGLRISAHFDGWIDTDSVVFDVTGLSGETREVDVFRAFLQYANEQKDHRFKTIILAAFGKKKFVVPGEYFQQLGREFGVQNPMYTIRTFPHHVLSLNGTKPFPEYDGGILFVLGKEMEQFSDLNKEWYLSDYIERHR